MDDEKSAGISYIQSVNGILTLSQKICTRDEQKETQMREDEWKHEHNLYNYKI